MELINGLIIIIAVFFIIAIISSETIVIIYCSIISILRKIKPQLVKNFSISFFEDWKEDSPLFYHIYEFFLFITYMIKITIVDLYIRDENHKWLLTKNLEQLKENHRILYINYQTKVRIKKHSQSL